MPTVSIVIPTYNRASVLPRAVRSVLDQTFDDCEVIIVDDGSTDETPEIVDSFSEDRIRYLRFSENQGANAARNAGVEVAKGDYIAFLDADDEWRPAKLERQVEVFEQAPKSVGLVYTGIVHNDSNGNITGRSIPEHSGDVLARLMRGNFIGTFSSVMVRSQVMNDISLNEELPSWQDWYFYLDVAEEWSVESVSKPLVVKYFDIDNRISKNYKEKREISYPILYEKLVELNSEVGVIKGRQTLASLDFRIGYNALTNGYYSQARISLVRSLIKYPIQTRGWLYFVAALGGRFTYEPLRNLKRHLSL
ncbi:glycoprotein 3-alpha-L-fucosyltransferase [Halorhabdus tiamatea SARL4B]|uniref:Glycoprotein 3-alpha-L-fucosyltransferase n=1 Tax=Halorhabdus tiamatea SARL4B TaxID=1033806 RepID=U2FAA6_9EURY|nr:glycosyltransferase family 2 protein [Halorhabdus tiamatea]ERJ05404.1 glycoprotein 3-alpha-L-fucosyltransferase [Halorhabdus tiamatea SARL4B]